MAKNDTKTRNGGVERIATVDNPNQGGVGLFTVAIGLILVAGVAATVFLATQRESNIDVAPISQIDHWHSALLVHNCGTDLPPTGNFDTVDGLHTHGDGLLHIHPYNTTVSGRNANLGEYFEAFGAELTDDSFTTGFADPVPSTLSEADGCNGEEAELKLSVWRNAFDDTAEAEIITEDLGDFRFETAGMALTLALVPVGEDPPKPSAEQIAILLQNNPGGPIFGVEEGDNPIILPDDGSDTETEADADEDSTDAESEDSTEAEDLTEAEDSTDADAEAEDPTGTAEDTAEDTEEDTAEDTEEDTAEDTEEDTAEDTEADS